MTEAAEAAGLINMVNLTYRNAAAIQTARRMVEDGRDRRRPPRPGELPAELARRPPLGRLAHRGALALAPLLRPRLQGRARRHRRPHPRLRHLRHLPRHRRPAGPHEDLRQGRRRRDRRLQARRQRQRRDDGRALERRARRRPHEPLRHRQGQRPRPDDPRRQGRAEGLGQREDLEPRGLPRPRHRDPDLGAGRAAARPRATRSASSSRCSPARTASPTSATPPGCSSSSTSASSPTPKPGCCRCPPEPTVGDRTPIAAPPPCRPEPPRY